MKTRSCLRLGSALGALSLSAVAMTPALAAGNIAASGANAFEMSIAGNGEGTGTASATHNGSKETRTGEANPPVSVLQNQKLLNVGVLAQQATAQKRGGEGYSAACAGVAGNGASVAEVGDSRCLTPGAPVGLALANLDLSKTLVINPASALGPLAEANAPLATILGSVTGPLAEGIKDTPLGPTGLTGTFGAIESDCTARPGNVSGGANLVDSKLILNVAGEEVVLVNLPARPAPNTDLLINLDEATGVILGAVETQLETMFSPPPGGGGPLAPLRALPEGLQDQVIVALVEATREQLLTQLSDNVLKVILNKQSRPTANSIKVRAIDLALLPAAQAELGAPLVGVQIASVACGADTVTLPPIPDPTEKPKPDPVPTTVPAGIGGDSAGGGVGSSPNGIVLAAFALLFVGGGTIVGIRLRG